MRRIRRDEIHEELLKELTSGETPLFKDLWRILLFAAMLGFKRKSRIPLGSFDSGKAMPDSYFANSPAWPGTLYLLGLVESEKTAVMGSKPEDQDELITIFEEYANGGLAYFKSRLDSGGDRLKTLVDIIQEATATPGPGMPNLNFEPV